MKPTNESLKDGIISVYKPTGMTSNDVIYKMRAVLGIKKIGHTGTLDPMATGVLPICINRSTRVAEYLDVDFKTYKAVMRLGVVTSTLDMTGEVEEIRDASRITESDIVKALSTQIGIIEQLPPLISAIRIDGRRLYEFVHDGEEIPPEIAKKIKPRKVFIRELAVDSVEMEPVPLVHFTVTCSKGTYIRSIVRDAGELLGCGASLETLERTASGVFTKENSVPLSELIDIALEEGLIEMMSDCDSKQESQKCGTLDGASQKPAESSSSGSQMPAEYMIKRLRRFTDEVPEVFRKYVFGTDYPLVHFGKAVVSPEDAGRFIDGWHLAYNEVDIVEKPEFSKLMNEITAITETAQSEKNRKISKTEIGDDNTAGNAGSSPGLRIRSEYAGMYKIYSTDGSFIGVAKHSDKYKKLVCDKVFYRV